MLVVVVAVGGVPMPVVDVVHMVAVRHRDVPTSLAVDVVVGVVAVVPRGLALVEVPVVGAVQMSVVGVVHVVAVGDGDVAASLAVYVAVSRVLGVCRRHDPHPSSIPDVPRQALAFVHISASRRRLPRPAG